MQVWLALVGLTYLALYSSQYLTRTLYDADSFAFGSPVWLRLSGLVVACAIMFLAGVELTRDSHRKMKRFLIIVFLIYLLALLVLLTGGFINSPFSGVISLYLGFFLALIQAGQYRRLSLVFVSIIIACIVAPYIYLCWRSQGSLEILKWHASAPTTAVRLVITISLLLVTGWFGGRVSSEVTQLSMSRGNQTTPPQ